MRTIALMRLQNNSSSDIEKAFPDALRDPILRRVQFSEISRIDELGKYMIIFCQSDPEANVP